MNKRVSICDNHLVEFYDAIKIGDLRLMSMIEHELTVSEKCVACSYIFKTQGTVRDALIDFFGEDSGLRRSDNYKAIDGRYLYWMVRGGMLAGIVLLTGMVLMAVKQLLLKSDFSLGIIDFTFILVVSLVVFLYIDDSFFD